ncbi:MAG: 50S ribosomal protein L6 [Candidatus Theseobacter exili]|nr:50S ribosomal protein L6 [Candidatus Theseobacter exili]
MSRIGKMPVQILNGVTVALENDLLKVKGAKGELSQIVPVGIKTTITENEIVFTRETDTKRDKACHGLIRSLAANMVRGVSEGYEKTLEIVGVGYRAKNEGRDLVINLGFSHPVNFIVPEDVLVKVEENTKIKISGIDKQKVGEVAAKIRRFYPPEPYKGKGIRYSDEYVRRKAGKTVA